MELTTARKLADLNRRFYEDHAIAFAHRRATPQRGVRRILAMIPGGATVLELGCGDGKAAQALAAGSQIAAYLGLDLSPALLERARKVTGDEQRETAPGPHTPSPVTRRTSFAFAIYPAPPRAPKSCRPSRGASTPAGRSSSRIGNSRAANGSKGASSRGRRSASARPRSKPTITSSHGSATTNAASATSTCWTKPRRNRWPKRPDWRRQKSSAQTASPTIWPITW